MPCFCVGLCACAATAAATALGGVVGYYFYGSVENIKEDCCPTYEPELIIDSIAEDKDCLKKP
jgi:hypothetical protein